MTKVYDAVAIREKLETNDKWLVRGILAIYAKQTADEKSTQMTKYTNGVGFNGRDAVILSSFAKQILAWQATENPRYPSPLSPKQFALARRAMPKYAAQLARIAAENNPVEDEQDGVFDPAEIDMRMKQMEQQGEQDADRELYEAEMRAERAAIMASERSSDFEGYDDEFHWN